MWGPAVESSTILRTTAREIRADSLVLTVHACDVGRGRRLCGGSDPDRIGLAALVVSVILERPTCLTCIAAKVGAPVLAVVRTVEGIGGTINVKIANDERCRMCGSTLGPTYSLPR